MQGGWQEPKILQRVIPDPVMVDNYNELLKDDGVSSTLRTNCGTSCKGNGLSIMEPVIAASRGRNVDNPSDRTPGNVVEQRLEINKEGTSNTITTVPKDNYLMVPSATKVGYEKLYDGDSVNLTMPKSTTRRGRRGDMVAQTLDTSCNIGVVFINDVWWWVRKLTPRECLRLQDFPDSFKIVVSDSQAYKQAGNSMSVNVLKMIFRQIEVAKVGEVPMGRLF